MAFRNELHDTVVIGAGQSGISMSDNLSRRGIEHVVLEQDEVANRWRKWRWDSLVANGPAWSNCLPGLPDNNFHPDDFQPKDAVADYLERFADNINMPVHTGVRVDKVTRDPADSTFLIETSKGPLRARRIVSAVGAYQNPFIPDVGTIARDVRQLHSVDYKNPEQLPAGAILVVGAGSSGAQIADELLSQGRKVFLSIAAHNRTPRRYRGRDYNWWLGVLGDWDRQTEASSEHYTVAVSGVDGGKTIDYKEFAGRGVILLGMVKQADSGKLYLADNLRHDIEQGDQSLVRFLRRVDEYIRQHDLDFPEDPDAYKLLPDPDCVENPILELDLKAENITSIVWATGFNVDYSWLQVKDALDERGYPNHHRGESAADGIYFIGLPFLTSFGSSFLISVWHDADMLANLIERRARFERGEQFLTADRFAGKSVRKAPVSAG